MHTHTHTHHAKFHSRMEHKHDHWAPKWEHYTEHRWAEQPVPCLHTHITHTLKLHTHIPAFITPIGLPCSPFHSLSSHTYQSQLIGGLLNEIFLFQNWYDTLHIGNTAHVHSYKYVLTITPTYPSTHMYPHTCHSHIEHNKYASWTLLLGLWAPGYGNFRLTTTIYPTSEN